MKKGAPILSAESVFNRLKKYAIGKVEEKQFGRAKDTMLIMVIRYDECEYRVSLIKHTNVSRLSISTKDKMQMFCIQSALVTTTGSGVIHEEIFPVFPRKLHKEEHYKANFDIAFEMVNTRLTREFKLDYPLHIVPEVAVA